MRMTPARLRWLAVIGAAAVRAVGATWRVRVGGRLFDTESPRLLFAFLHGDMLFPAVVYRRQRSAVMISHHGDGELIARVVQRLGRTLPVRGSSTRGGARAFLEMVRGHGDIPWAITPDGPRGPRGRVQEGALQLAAESERAIIPAGYAAAPCRRLRSWDRFAIPAPFARVACHLAHPLAVPRYLDRAQRRALAAELEERLRLAEQEAQRMLRDW